MSKLIIMRGLPGSGKTTYARNWVSEDYLGRVRVNRDDLRGMAHDSFYAGQQTERSIMAIRDAAIITALKLGKDVVCDDTNLPNRTVRDLVRLARLVHADWEIVDLTNVPLETCMDRNRLRDRKVPEEVIEDYWKRFVRGKPYPLPFTEPEIEAMDAEPYVPDPTKPKAIIVDIDGTVALKGDRDPFDEPRVHEDKPNWPVVEDVRMHWAKGYHILFTSGRTEACRDATAKWIRANVLPIAHKNDWSLFMRAVGDGRPDYEVKLELFNLNIRNNFCVVLAEDDRDQVVKMWRSIGLTVFQVAEGNF